MVWSSQRRRLGVLLDMALISYMGAARSCRAQCTSVRPICTRLSTAAALTTRAQAEPISGSILMFLAVVLWMKLVSYHHCCFDLRMARRCGEIRPGERGSGDTPAQDWGPLARWAGEGEGEISRVGFAGGAAAAA